MTGEIDSSALSKIGQGFDYGGSVEKAYKLKDYQNEQKIHSMQLTQLTQQFADDQSTREALKGDFDFTKTEDQLKAVEAVRAKAGGQAAMKLQSQFQDMNLKHTQTQEADVKLKTMLAQLPKIEQESRQEKVDGFLMNFEPLMLDYKQRTEAGEPAKKVAAELQTKYRYALANMADAKGVDGQYLYRDPQSVQMLNSLGPQFDPTKIEQAVRGSQKVSTILDETLGKESTRKHQRVEENQGERRLGIEGARLGIERQKMEYQQSGGLTDDAVDLMAGQLVAGAKARDVMVNMGRGTQGAVDIRRINNAYAKKLKELGISPQDIIAKQQEVQGAAKEVQSAASIAGKINYAEQELDRTVPIARQASEKVSRGSFVPFNKLKQMGQAAIGDPDLKELYVYTNTVLNAYDMLAARGGTDQEKRAQNRKMLETADSPAAYNAALSAILVEAQASQQAGQASMRSPLRTGSPGGVSGSPPSPSSNPSGAKPTATGRNGEKVEWNGQAWVPVNGR